MSVASDQDSYARVYGLTGIIGSGKSTVASILRGLGAEVLDADEIARYVVTPQYSGYAELRKLMEKVFRRFTSEPIFADDASLKRDLLADLIFDHPERVAELNMITHPAIKTEFRNRMKLITTPKVFYDVPLLFETGINKKVKKSILVYAPESVCTKRAADRLKLPESAIIARLKNQISIEKKREMADYIIENTGSMEDLQKNVEALYNRLV